MSLQHANPNNLFSVRTNAFRPIRRTFLHLHVPSRVFA